MRKNLLIGIVSFLLGSAIFFVIGAITLQNNTNRVNKILGLSQKLWDVEIRIGNKCDDKRNKALCEQRDALSREINDLIYQFEGFKKP